MIKWRNRKTIYFFIDPDINIDYQGNGKSWLPSNPCQLRYSLIGIRIIGIIAFLLCGPTKSNQSVRNTLLTFQFCSAFCCKKCYWQARKATRTKWTEGGAGGSSGLCACGLWLRSPYYGNIKLWSKITNLYSNSGHIVMSSCHLHWGKNTRQYRFCLKIKEPCIISSQHGFCVKIIESYISLQIPVVIGF